MVHSAAGGGGLDSPDLLADNALSENVWSGHKTSSLQREYRASPASKPESVGRNPLGGGTPNPADGLEN